MGGEPKVLPMNDAWVDILKCLILEGDIIEVSDEREKSFLVSDLSFICNTDTAERILPQDDEMIDPLNDLDALIEWFENNPDKLKRLTNLINKTKNS